MGGTHAQAEKAKADSQRLRSARQRLDRKLRQREGRHNPPDVRSQADGRSRMEAELAVKVPNAGQALCRQAGTRAGRPHSETALA